MWNNKHIAGPHVREPHVMCRRQPSSPAHDTLRRLTFRDAFDWGDGSGIGHWRGLGLCAAGHMEQPGVRAQHRDARNAEQKAPCVKQHCFACAIVSCAAAGGEELLSGFNQQGVAGLPMSPS